MLQHFRAGSTGKLLLLAVVIGALNFKPSAQARVYATAVQINGGFTNITAAQGTSLSISYILNEPATAGVTVRILSGATVVRTLTFADGGVGALRGMNTVTWDGLDSTSHPVPAGTYTVSVTAAATGYSSWTHFITDDDPNSYVYDGRGVTVNRNPASPYYGRIYVANASVGLSPLDTPGDNVAVLQFNSDSSTPPEGIVTSLNHNWSGDGNGPRDLEFGGTNRIYALDALTGGDIFSWLTDFSTNSMLAVLSSGNRPGGAHLNGFTVSQQGSNRQLWAADNAGTSGILRWTLGSDGTCTAGDQGTTVVGFGDAATGLSLPPQDVALDASGNIYTCQSVTESGVDTPVVLRFHAYDPATNGGAPELVADWTAGAQSSTYGGVTGIAVDPTGTYVAASFEGVLEGGFPVNGNTKVLYATNGALASEIDLNYSVQGNSTHQDTACAWDAVGNLYYVDFYFGRWRAVSPPGTNQSTTAALAQITVTASQPTTPQITRISLNSGTVTILFTGGAADTASQFKLLSTPSLNSAFAQDNAASISQVVPGQFQVTTSSNGPARFYRIQR